MVGPQSSYVEVVLAIDLGLTWWFWRSFPDTLPSSVPYFLCSALDNPWQMISLRDGMVEAESTWFLIVRLLSSSQKGSWGPKSLFQLGQNIPRDKKYSLPDLETQNPESTFLWQFVILIMIHIRESLAPGCYGTSTIVKWLLDLENQKPKSTTLRARHLYYDSHWLENPWQKFFITRASNNPLDVKKLRVSSITWPSSAATVSLFADVAVVGQPIWQPLCKLNSG